jgi:hypothetical protein
MAIKILLAEKGVTLHDLPDQEMYGIIYSDDIIKVQSFYGNPLLLQTFKNDFQER